MIGLYMYGFMEHIFHDLHPKINFTLYVNHTPAEGGPRCCRQCLLPLGFDISFYEFKGLVCIDSKYAVCAGVPG